MRKIPVVTLIASLLLWRTQGGVLLAGMWLGSSILQERTRPCQQPRVIEFHRSAFSGVHILLAEDFAPCVHASDRSRNAGRTGK
jgi:hypothetical protein